MKDLELLQRFLSKAANSANPLIQEQGVDLGTRLMEQGEDESVIDAELQSGKPDFGQEGEQPRQELEDKVLISALPEMVDDDNPSSFGKVSRRVTVAEMLRRKMKAKQASAYIRDTEVSSLPEGTVKDIERFAGQDVKKRKVIQYGMVVKELVPKADRHNFELAMAHVRESLSGKSRKAALEEFFKQQRTKFIIILNDSIIDGHHFLAKAKTLGVTSSLNVIDLTPVRFQKTARSRLLHGHRNNRR